MKVGASIGLLLPRIRVPPYQRITTIMTDRAKAAGGDVSEGDDVAQGFAHLAAVNFDVVIV